MVVVVMVAAGEVEGGETAQTTTATAREGATTTTTSTRPTHLVVEVEAGGDSSIMGGLTDAPMAAGDIAVEVAAAAVAILAAGGRKTWPNWCSRYWPSLVTKRSAALMGKNQHRLHHQSQRLRSTSAYSS